MTDPADKSSRDKFEVWMQNEFPGVDLTRDYRIGAYYEDHYARSVFIGWTAALASVSTQPMAGPGDADFREWARDYYEKYAEFPSGLMTYAWVMEQLRPLPLLTAALLPEKEKIGPESVTQSMETFADYHHRHGYNAAIDEMARRINALAKEGGR